MKYERPSLSRVSALSVIHGSTNKSVGSAIDANMVQHNATKPAYEADE
jgi:hypothetical protein